MFPVPPTSNGTINPNLLNPATLTHLLSNGSAQQLLQTIPQILNNPHTNPNPPPLLNPLAQPLLSTAPNLLSTATSQSASQHRSQMNSSSHYAEPKMHPQTLPRNPSPPNTAGNPNRLANNGEISITTNHGPNSSQNMKRSPSSLSPNCTDSSTADLLIDSPSKYYIIMHLVYSNTKFDQKTPPNHHNSTALNITLQVTSSYSIICGDSVLDTPGDLTLLHPKDISNGMLQFIVSS